METDDTTRTGRTGRTDRGADMRERILAAAREELAAAGPTALSVRSIARRHGVAAGGLYRYVEGRDDLLTALILEAYEDLGAAAEQAAAGTERTPAQQWVAVWLAVRERALERPHDFALVYGTPVIGYAAPARTVTAATRLIRVLAQLAVHAHPAPDPDAAPDAALAEDLATVRAWSREMLEDGDQVTDEVALLVLRGWTEGIGTIGFELHGHFVGSIRHGEAYLAHVARAQARALGLPGATPAPTA